MTAITAADVADKLTTVDAALTALARTEPVSERIFPVGSDVHFDLAEVPQDFEDLGGGELSGAVLTLGKAAAESFPLTVDAFLRITSMCGLPQAYVRRTPMFLIAPQLDYWVGAGMGLGDDKDIKLILTGDADPVGAAFVRSTLEPYSSLELAESVLDKMTGYYHIGREDIVVDRKLFHDVATTQVRFIVPERSRTLSTPTPDDRWSMGVQMTNSLIGQKSTAVEGYLFRWWCANGATDTHATSGVWSRKGNTSSEDMLAWAQAAVDDILGGLEGSLDAVQELTDINVSGEVGATLRDLFGAFNIPVRQREGIISYMAETEDTSMYQVMAAVTAEANRDGLTAAQVADLQRAGGSLPYAATERCGECHRLLGA